MKKFRWLLAGLAALALIWGWKRGGWFRTWGEDFGLGVVYNQGVGVVLISGQRMMINSLLIEGETELWVPRGLAWYRADRVKKLLEQEERQDLADEILFYNLGFAADRVIYVDNFADWERRGDLFRLMGLLGWLRYLYQKNEMLPLIQDLKGDLRQNEFFLDETMVRDFADSQILAEEVRVSVVNTTCFQGLANFMAQRLGWLGLAVVRVANEEKETGNCLLVYEKGLESSRSLTELKKIFDCQHEEDESLGRGEVELYLGDELGRVLNYDAYVRTF